MRAIVRMAVVTLVIVVGSTAFAPTASAGCAPTIDPARPDRLAPTNGAGYRPVSFVLYDDRDSEDPSIVGLWQITFTSKDTSGIPDGTVIDAGYATWHADGTEIMNSGRPPITSSFCMG